MAGLGRLLMILGALVFAAGFVLAVFGRWLPLGRLPGDITVHRGGFVFAFPLATSLLLSIILSVILWLLNRH